MSEYIKNHSLNWTTEDIYVNTPDELGVKLTEDEAQELLEEFFEEHEDWLAERINEAMSDFIYMRLSKK